jgi:hypothetical protein
MGFAGNGLRVLLSILGNHVSELLSSKFGLGGFLETVWRGAVVSDLNFTQCVRPHQKTPKTRPVYSASGDEVHGFPRSDTVTLADAQEDELWPGTFMPGQVAPKL